MYEAGRTPLRLSRDAPVKEKPAGVMGADGSRSLVKEMHGVGD
jgi:hypothetical protein